MPTLKELAALAGVSVSTVSKALNNSPDIAEETRDYIVGLAHQEGYQRKFRKKSAARPSSIAGPKIGLIYSDVVSRYYSRVIDSYNRRIREMDGALIACDAGFSQERAVALCNYLDQQCHVDGIISISNSGDPADFPKTKVPLVGTFGSRNFHKVMEGYLPCDLICINSRTGIIQAIEHLQSLGHTDFAFLGETHAFYRERLFRELAEEHRLNIPENRIRISRLRFEEAGYDAMRQLLEEDHRPTAVLCAYDDIAVGASKAILEAGLRVPEDISLVGFDNSSLRLYNQKTLASVDSFIEDQTRLVLEMLMSRITDPACGAIRNISLQTAFVPHETVGPARNSE